MASSENTALKVALLIVSDTASQDASTDKSTSALRSVFESSELVKWQVVETAIVPDDTDQIQRYIKLWSDEKNINCILTSGGTGFAVKDKTPEAIEPLIHRHAPGLIHAMLASSLAITPFAMMARPVAGTRNQSLIVTLPGSPKGAKENLEAIIKFLPHACNQAAGGDSRAMHAGGVKKLEKEAGVVGGTGEESGRSVLISTG
jgi:gephyrin